MAKEFPEGKRFETGRDRGAEGLKPTASPDDVARIKSDAESIYPDGLSYAQRARELYVRSRLVKEGFATSPLTPNEEDELLGYDPAEA